MTTLRYTPLREPFVIFPWLLLAKSVVFNCGVVLLIERSVHSLIHVWSIHNILGYLRLLIRLNPGVLTVIERRSSGRHCTWIVYFSSINCYRLHHHLKRQICIDSREILVDQTEPYLQH